MGETSGLAFLHVLQKRVSSTPTSTLRFYRPGLDVIRFTAFFCVFLSHALAFYPAPPWSMRLALQGGMCLFFVLSSYLITELLLREQNVTGYIHLRAFYMRRILRIWPLYFAALAMAFVTGLFWQNVHIKVSCLIAYLLLIGNWYNVLREPMHSPWQPLWSISLEEQFYLLWPFLVNGGRVYIWSFSLLSFPIAACMIAYCTGILGYAPMDIHIWFNSVVQFQYFGLGAILALVLRGTLIKLRTYQQVLMGFVSAVLLYATGALFVTTHNSGGVVIGYLLIGIACLTFFLALIGDNCSGLKRPFVGLGKISYGLYVFHNPCLVLTAHGLKHIRFLAADSFRFGTANLILGLFLTVIVSKCSYNLLEKPFLRLKRHFEFIETRSL